MACCKKKDEEENPAEKDEKLSRWSKFKWEAKRKLQKPIWQLVLRVVLLGIILSIVDVISDVYTAYEFYLLSENPSMQKCSDDSWLIGSGAWRPYVIGTALFVCQPGVIYGIKKFREIQLALCFKFLLLPIYFPAMALVGIFVPLVRYCNLVKQHLKSIKEGERVVETKMDLKASEAKILESLAEAAPQIIVQTSLIVILISDYIRQQNDSSEREEDKKQQGEDCENATTILKLVVWPIISNIISIISLSKGMVDHLIIQVKALKLKAQEAPFAFKLTYGLLCIFTVSERLLLFIFPGGSLFNEEYTRFSGILLFMFAIQMVCRWIAFGREDDMWANSWLSFVVPSHHLKVHSKETVIYLGLHGLCCQAFTVILFWMWPEVLPIWNTSGLASLRSGLDLTVEVRSGTSIAAFMVVMALSNLVKMLHIRYGLESLYNCELAYPSKEKLKCRLKSFPPWWPELDSNSDKPEPKDLAEQGHFYSDENLLRPSTQCFDCGFEVSSWTTRNLETGPKIHKISCEYEKSKSSEEIPLGELNVAKGKKTLWATVSNLVGKKETVGKKSSIEPLLGKDVATFPSMLWAMVPLMLTILNINAYLVLMEQRCYSYYFYFFALLFFFFSFELIRWSTLPHYSIAKLLLTFPLIYHLSYNIYYIRRECCSSGIPYRPAFREISGSGENEKYRKVDEATLNFYRGVLIAFGIYLALAIPRILYIRWKQMKKQFDSTFSGNEAPKPIK